MGAILKAINIIFILALSFVAAKKMECRSLLRKDDKNFMYCTKFTVPPGHTLKANLEALFTKNMLHQRAVNATDEIYKANDHITLAIGLYKFQDWHDMIDVENITC